MTRILMNTARIVPLMTIALLACQGSQFDVDPDFSPGEADPSGLAAEGAAEPSASFAADAVDGSAGPTTGAMGGAAASSQVVGGQTPPSEVSPTSSSVGGQASESEGSDSTPSEQMPDEEMPAADKPAESPTEQSMASGMTSMPSAESETAPTDMDEAEMTAGTTDMADPTPAANPNMSAMTEPEKPAEPTPTMPMAGMMVTCPQDGASCKVGVGACERNGTYQCTSAGESACSAKPGTAIDEQCSNGKDDDCDGNIDEVAFGRCCSNSDCGAGTRCSALLSICVAETQPTPDPTPTQPDPAPAQPSCGDGNVDNNAFEACDYEEDNVTGLCDNSCRVTDLMYSKTCRNAGNVDCFPGRGVFDFVICGANFMCVAGCVADFQCQASSGRATDARCVKNEQGGSWCLDKCFGPNDCRSGQQCIEGSTFGSPGEKYCASAEFVPQ